MRFIFISVHLFLGFYSIAQNYNFVWNGIIVSNDAVPIPYANLQINTSDKHLIFSTDNKGQTNIQYDNFSVFDTLIVSHIGFEKKKIACKELLKSDTLILNKLIYKIDDITITPSKPVLLKYGNLHRVTLLSYQLSFNDIGGIYIPYKKPYEQIIKIRIYLQDFKNEKWNYRPFRLRLFKGEGIENDILEKEIIVSLPKNKRHWIEIDISDLGIYIPKEGISVAVQALSYSFYKKNGYIENYTVKYNKYQVINSILLGVTNVNKKDTIKSFMYYLAKGRYIKMDIDYQYLIQVLVQSGQ